MLATAPGFVAVTCGVHLGDITVTTEIWGGRPEPDPASWEDVAATFEYGTQYVTATPVKTAGPNDPVEHHLIQIWPDTPHPDELLKATDNTGAR